MYTSTGTLRKPDSIKEYAPLVKRIAHHMMSKLPASVQLDDIIQAGLIGLMDAINRYEEEQGVKFETYATQRIRGAMLDELRSNDWLPRGVRRSQRKIETALRALEQKFGRSPKEREVAAEMGVTLEEYQTLLQEARGCQLLYIEDFNDEDREGGFLERNTRTSTTRIAKAVSWKGTPRGPKAIRSLRCTTSGFARRWSPRSRNCPSAKSC